MVTPVDPHTEDFLRLVIDRIPTMVWSLTPEGVLDFVNQPWIDYTGISFAEAMRELGCLAWFESGCPLSRRP